MDVAVEWAAWVVGKALGPATDVVLEAWAASVGLGSNVEALKKELLCVKALLEHTRGKEISNSALEEMMQNLRNKAYDAEDVLDELDYFRIQDDLYGLAEAADVHPKGCGHNLVLNARHSAKAVAKRLLYSCACSSPVVGDADPPGMLVPCDEAPKSVFDRVDASMKMMEIVEQLQSMRKVVSEILTPLGPGLITTREIGHNRSSTISESTEPRLYGRDLIMKSIIHDITKGQYCDKDDLTVLPIFGQGGIGKTTLAQHIYHNQQVQSHFDVKVWECVSLKFDRVKLLEDIVKYVPKLEQEKGGTSGELIEQRLKSKRFLLALDDMWECTDEEEWKKLLLPFRKSQAKGNIIIVTTRFSALAGKVKTTNRTIELEGIKGAEFEELFLSFVFGDDQSARKDHALLETGLKIMDKLKGSPLAAKTVGRLLRDHLDLNHWDTILKSKEWESADNDNDSNIMPALKLSYDYMPFHLQQCFLYCALFPEDYRFKKEELIYFWIGQDILQSHCQNKSIEDIGLRNLDDLVSHGFFKKEEENGHNCYIIHDLLHDLALKVASNECLVISHTDVRSLEIRPSVRHLCIDLEQANGDSDGANSENFISELMKILDTKLKIEHLRTLMVFGEMNEKFTNGLGNLIRKASGLRVLHLSDMRSLMGFITLPHLRYLSLGKSGYSEIHIPIILSRFYHLRILDLQKWCGSLDLPRDLSNLTKLGHFLTKDDEDHSKICNAGKLQFLQELKRFRVNKESNGFEPKQLGELIDIRELGIYNLEKIHSHEEAIKANMMQKIYLQKLTLDWCTEVPRNERDVEGLILEKLEPQRYLQELCIRGHGSGSGPTWLGSKLSVKALRSLHLAGVEWEVLPSLGHMRVLYELTLENMSTLKEFGPRHFGSITKESFCSLKRLTLIALKGLEKWDLGDHCHLLSQLEVLSIKDCPDLLGLPFDPPTSQDHQEGKIHWFANLQDLEIKDCSKVRSLPPIPWTQTLCSIKINEVGSSVLKSLKYTKSRFVITLEIEGNHDVHGLYEKALAFNNLTNLQKLYLKRCPPLESKHLQMLKSLKVLSVKDAKHVFTQSVNESEAEWQLPAVTGLSVTRCEDTGKGLSQLLSHFPKLSTMSILGCKKITRMGVAAPPVLHQPTAHVPLPATSAGSTIEIKDLEETENVADGLLLLPAHLSGSLRELGIYYCLELSLVRSSLPVLPNCSRAGQDGEGGGLQALRSLQILEVNSCHVYFSAYKKKTSFSSTTYFPFPSSLNKLKLCDVDLETLQPLANLTSLTKLNIFACDDLRSDGLWPLVTQGQLRKLEVMSLAPRFFIGTDIVQSPKDEDQVRLLCHSSKLQELRTDDVTGFLTKPICTVLSSSLTRLLLDGDNEDDEDEVLSCFTAEQENALQHLTSLQVLIFSRFSQKQCLPAGLHKLPNLQMLQIRNCELISRLPSDGLPNSLQMLHVEDCCNEELIQECRKFVKDNPRIKLII